MNLRAAAHGDEARGRRPASLRRIEPFLYSALGAAAGAGGLFAASRCTGSCGGCFGCAGGALLVAFAALRSRPGTKKKEKEYNTWNG